MIFIPDIVNSFFTRFDAGRFMMRAISEFSSSSSKLKESLISSAAPSSSSVSLLSFSGDWLTFLKDIYRMWEHINGSLSDIGWSSICLTSNFTFGEGGSSTSAS
jgi:hypothetical protein